MHPTLRSTLALSAIVVATQATAQVTFYEREGFQGESFTTRRQVQDFGRFGFNDRASSAVVAGEGGERWRVCEDVRFGGNCVVLRPGQYPSLREMGLNNRVSSAEALAREQPAAPVAGRIVFFEKENLSGRSFTAQGEVANFAPTGFNDRISSIEVFGGPWEVCRDSGFAGPCVILRQGQYPSLVAMGLNNSISSVRLAIRQEGPPVATARVVFHERENFTGRSFTAQEDVADFGRFGFNDRASSVEVFGAWFEVCQGGGYSGPCAMLRPGKYPSLVSMGLDNRISSMRLVGPDGAAVDYRAGPGSAGRPAYDPRRRQNEELFDANVTAVRAVVGPPEQRCWVDRDQVAREPARTNLPATIAGAVIGGILGHQIGDGRGRDLATVGGAVAGGAIGATVGRDGRGAGPAQDVQRCTTVPNQARAELWDVTYDFRGQQHRVQMTAPPGATITVNRDGEPRV
jgi:uncharacterized protein YcfJ